MQHRLHTLVTICLSLAVSSLAQAQELNEVQLERVERLEELGNTDSFHHIGPNCFATTLYAAGITDNMTFNNSAFYYFVVESPFCEEVPAEQRQTGDLAMVSGFLYRHYDLVAHGALLTSKETAISKMGFQANESARRVVHGSLEENIGSYIEPECHMSLRSSDDHDCREYTEATYYRCDVKELRQFLSLGKYAAPLKAFREKIEPHLLNEKEIPLTQIKQWQEELTQIDTSLAAELKAKFPDHYLTTREGKVAMYNFGTGHASDYYPSYVYGALSKEFQIASIQIMKVIDLREQLHWLEGVAIQAAREQ